jgi:hypothetical protein
MDLLGDAIDCDDEPRLKWNHWNLHSIQQDESDSDYDSSLNSYG